jgi:hypothetical protein
LTSLYSDSDYLSFLRVGGKSVEQAGGGSDAHEMNIEEIVFFFE